MRSEPFPLSSFSRRALRLYFIFALMLWPGCATPTPKPTVRLTPPVDQDPFVVRWSVPSWREICVERMLADDPDAIGRYDCISVGELRQIVKHRLRADN